MILLIGAVLGFFSVLFGAYSEHSLRGSVTEEQFRQLMTAIRYNQVNSIVISSIGLALISNSKIFNSSIFKFTGFLFILGTILFSFSIYVSIVFEVPKILYLTPVGGITIMLSWITLAIFAFRSRKW